MPCQIIPFPQELRPQLPTVVGNVDYLTFRQRLEQIDALLRDSGTECHRHRQRETKRAVRNGSGHRVGDGNKNGPADRSTGPCPS